MACGRWEGRKEESHPMPATIGGEWLRGHAVCHVRQAADTHRHPAFKCTPPVREGGCLGYLDKWRHAGLVSGKYRRVETCEECETCGRLGYVKVRKSDSIRVILIIM